MRNTYLLVLCLLLFSCGKNKAGNSELSARLDSLEKKLAESYKPGFGELMSNIQAHHAKLWFAGKEQNWKLAEFEVHEITESLDDIEKYQAERKESAEVGMIRPPVDSITLAIGRKDHPGFVSAYTLLTNTCNDCHRATEFQFNSVKIPDNQPFSNQDFKAKD